MYKRILITTALVSTLLAGNALACSQGGGSMKMNKGGQVKGHKGDTKKHLVRKIIAAVSKSGIDAAQVEKVTDAINAFKQKKMAFQASRPIPLEAFKNDSFNKAAFRKIMLSKPEAVVDAKAALLEDVYAVLNQEQRKIFTREFTAVMVEKTIKKNMIKGYMMPKKGHGGSCK